MLYLGKNMSKYIQLGNKHPMKKFVKTYPHHSILFGVGSTLLAIIAVTGGLIWHSSSSLYAEQASQNSSAYVSNVSNALAGNGNGSTADKPQAQAPGQAAGTPAPAQTKSVAPAPASVQSAPAVSASASSLKGMNLFVDPSRASLPSPLNSASVATWLGGWSGDIQGAANAAVSSAANSGSIATLVAYNIPGRDCGSYSAGGASGSDAYKAWIRGFAAGIGNRQAIVIVEPDALAQVTCLDANGQSARYALLQDAVSVLASTTRATVYLDAGHSGWISASEMANRLQKAGVSSATGFSLNVSNFETTANNTSYGNTVSSKIGGKHFVIDTGRNGNGPGSTWCNPSGRALGESPTTNTSGNVDAYLWIKVPGESDGTCNGGPSAGAYWSDYAQSLIGNRH